MGMDNDQIVIDNPTAGDLRRVIDTADDDQEISVIIEVNEGKPSSRLVTRIMITDGILNLISNETAEELFALAMAKRMGGNG